MPDPIYARILYYLEMEWHVIRRAPLSLCIIAGIAASLGWFGVSQYYIGLYEGTIRELIASREAANQQRDYARDQIAELTARLRALGQSPQPHALQGTYTIEKTDEVEFVQTWRTVQRISDIEIAYAKGNKKATALAKRLSDLFEMCSWEVRQWTHEGTTDIPGVTIQAVKDNGFPASAGVLKALLTRYNIEARLQPLPPEEKLRDPWGSLRIFIGPDPQDIAR